MSCVWFCLLLLVAQLLSSLSLSFSSSKTDIDHFVDEYDDDYEENEYGDNYNDDAGNKALMMRMGNNIGVDDDADIRTTHIFRMKTWWNWYLTIYEFHAAQTQNHNLAMFWRFIPIAHSNHYRVYAPFHQHNLACNAAGTAFWRGDNHGETWFSIVPYPADTNRICLRSVATGKYITALQPKQTSPAPIKNVGCHAIACGGWESMSLHYSPNCHTTTPEEIVFIMDASHSVTSSGWTAEQSFVGKVILNDITHHTKVSIVRFSTSPASVQYPLTLANTDAIRQHIANVVVPGISYIGGQTHIYDALQLGRQQFDHGTNDPKFIILITDGNGNGAQDGHICQDLPPLLSNIRVIIIGVGDQVDKSLVQCLLSQDSDFIAVNSWQNLDAVRETVQKIVCIP